MNWHCTGESKWVERKFIDTYPNDDLLLAYTTIRTAQILQQKWVHNANEAVTDEEWRDVPVEKEE